MLHEAQRRTQSWSLVAVVAFSLFLDYFLYGMLLALGAHSPAGLHSEEHLSWMYGAYAISVLVVTPLFGYLGDRYGGRSNILCGVALAACAAALFGFGYNFQAILLARFLQGAASAALWTGGLSLIAAYYVERRVEMMGYAFTGSTAGSVLGPIAGGWISHLGGFELPFLITGALLLINGFLIALAVPRGRGNSRRENAQIGPLLLNRSFVIAALSVALAALAVGIIEPLLPARLAREGLTSKHTGLIFTISTLAYGLSAPVVGHVSNRLSINKVIALGAAVMAVALPLLAASRQAALVCVAVTLAYIGFAFMLNPASAELGNAAERAGMSCYSSVYAVYNVVYSVGMLGTAALASASVRSLGFLGALLCVSLILAFSIPLLLSTNATPVGAPKPCESEAN